MKTRLPAVATLAVVLGFSAIGAPVENKPAQSTAEDAVDISRGRPWLPSPPPSLTAAQQKTLDAFTRAFRLPDATPNGKGVKTEELAALQRKVREEYGIHWDGTALRGKPIASYTQGAEKEPRNPTGLQMFDILGTISQVARAYGKASKAQEGELKNLYLDLCRHILNQGLAEGTPVAHRSHQMFDLGPSVGYDWLGKSQGVLSMRTVLAEAGLLLPMTRAVSWWVNSDWLDETPHDNNSDFWRQGRWQDLDHSIAAMPDSPEKWQRLTAMMRYFSNNLVVGDALPVSGEFAHHWGFHLAYSYAMGFVLRDALNLHRASLELSPVARQRLRAYGRTVAWMLVDDVYTMNLSLRPAGLGRKAIAGELRLIADLGEPDGSGPIDREMAALYLACVKTGASDEDAVRYRAAGIAPAVLAGAMAMPTRPGLVWRRPETLVAVAAMRPHFRGYEVYGWNQCRYPVNGSVMVLKAHGEQPMPGFEPLRGWDWSLWPGATTLIETDVALTPRRGLGYGGNQSPLGGVGVLGDAATTAAYLQPGADAAGMFMVDFNPGNSTVTFRKSVFAVGGHVLVQTSGINAARKPRSDAPCVTTLYQDHLKNPSQPSVLDGAQLTQLPVAKDIRMHERHALTDSVGMEYVALPVPGMSRQPVLRVLRRHQVWRMPDPQFIKPGFDPKLPAALPGTLSTEEFLDRYIPQEGDFAVAYFDHGCAAKDAADAFVLTPAPTDKSELPVILEQTRSGHAALDVASRTCAYASFEPDVKWKSGPLVRSGRPAAVLVREMPGHSLKLSIASWDLKNVAPFSLTLKGVWQVLDAQANAVTATHANHQTNLKIPYLGDMPLTFQLKPTAR